MDSCATKSWLGRIYFFISIASINIAAKEIKSRTNQHLFSKIAFLTVLVGIINNRVYERAICWQVIFCTHFYHVYGKAIKFLLFLVFSASPFSHEFIALFVSEFCECKNWIIDWGTCHENPLICPTSLHQNFMKSLLRFCCWDLKISVEFPKTSRFFSRYSSVHGAKLTTAKKNFALSFGIFHFRAKYIIH